MSAKDQSGKEGVAHDREDATEERAFDDLAKRLGRGTISRGQALKLAGVSALGSMLGILSFLEDVQARQRKATAAQLSRRIGTPAGSRYRVLTNEPGYIHQRPCFSPQGDLVLFMRSPRGDPNKSSFWVVTAAGGEEGLFFEDKNIQATRPDWSWSRTSYEIAFTGQDGDVFGLYLLDVSTRDFRHLPLGDLENVEYPSWYPDGKSLAVTNYVKSGENQLFRVDLNDSSGSEEPSPVLTPLTDPTLVWAGMSSVSPDSERGNPIAFAGQKPNGHYDEATNQIWIQEVDKPPFQLDPLQGRTPWWSPDGQLVAFESNRDEPVCKKDPNCAAEVYQIFIESGGGSDARATTPVAWHDVQHPKWSPDSSSIVFSVGFPKVKGGSGIAIVDLPPSARQTQ